MSRPIQKLLSASVYVDGLAEFKKPGLFRAVVGLWVGYKTYIKLKFR